MILSFVSILSIPQSFQGTRAIGAFLANLSSLAFHTARGLPVFAKLELRAKKCDSWLRPTVENLAMTPAKAFELIHTFALAQPEAWKDHPRGEVVVKVREKVFVFPGTLKDGIFGLSLKPPRSAEIALLHPFAGESGACVENGA